MSTILVTGIGGNVGQGVLRAIKNAYPNFKLIGTDIAALTAGHYFCDEFYQVPFSYEESFKNKFLEIAAKENLDLIIPATDYEAYYLGTFAAELPPVVACKAQVTKIFLDKFLTYENFARHGIPFATAFLPSQFDHELKSFIVKPREGRGSRGLFINPENPKDFDDSSMIQEYIEGTEITSAFYICQDKSIIGPISFERELFAGMTNKCKVISTYNDQVLAIAQQINQHFDMAGPFNIQSRINSQGEVIPFEINCRYSGTTSIRSQLGFEDVKYGIQEHILKEKPQASEIKEGVALRVFMDIVYEANSYESIQAGSSQAKLF